MVKRKGGADSIDAWVSDVRGIASKLDRLQAEVGACADLSAMDTRSARKELDDIAKAVGSIKSRLDALKRGANGTPRRKFRPGRKPVSEEEAQRFAGRL